MEENVQETKKYFEPEPQSEAQSLFQAAESPVAPPMMETAEIPVTPPMVETVETPVAPPAMQQLTFSSDMLPQKKDKRKLPFILSCAGVGFIVLAFVLFLLLRPKEPERIELSQSAISVELNDSCTLTYTIEPTKVSNDTVQWGSDNVGVASVSDGVVTAHKTGIANITAKTVNGKEAVCEVTVVLPSIDQRLVGKWIVASMTDLNSGGSVNASSLDWSVTINGDYSGVFEGLTNPINFQWTYNKASDYYDIYNTTQSGMLLLFNNNTGNIEILFSVGDSSYSATCIKKN